MSLLPKALHGFSTPVLIVGQSANIDGQEQNAPGLELHRAQSRKMHATTEPRSSGKGQSLLHRRADK
jgi:hypothetical protein